MKKELVSNSSSLIFIGKLWIFNLLRNIYSRILIPEPVFDELFKFDKPENNLIQKEIDSNFIIKQDVKNIKEVPLHIGEKAAISLCLEKNIPLLLSDDKKARQYARSLSIKTIGVLGVIIKNLELEKINNRQAKEFVNKLIERGYYMSPELYSKILELMDEAKK